MTNQHASIELTNNDRTGRKRMVFIAHIVLMERMGESLRPGGQPYTDVFLTHTKYPVIEVTESPAEILALIEAAEQ